MLREDSTLYNGEFVHKHDLNWTRRDYNFLVTKDWKEIEIVKPQLNCHLIKLTTRSKFCLFMF